MHSYDLHSYDSIEAEEWTREIGQYPHHALPSQQRREANVEH